MEYCVAVGQCTIPQAGLLRDTALQLEAIIILYTRHSGPPELQTDVRGARHRVRRHDLTLPGFGNPRHAPRALADG